MKHVESTGVINTIENRQKKIKKHIGIYLKGSIYFTIAVYVIYQLLTKIFLNNDIASLKAGLHNLKFRSSIDVLIDLIFFVFVDVITLLFVIWSLTLVISTIMVVISSSRKERISSVSSNFRVIPLVMVTIIPIFLFALAWSSFGVSSVEIERKLNVLDFFIICGLSLPVAYLFKLALAKIPKHKSEIRFGIFQFMLYFSLFLAFGMGINVAAYILLFAILIVLTFNYRDIEDIFVWMSVYDIEEKLLVEIEKTIDSRNATRLIYDQVLTQKERLQTISLSNDYDAQRMKIDNDSIMENQRADLQRIIFEIDKKNIVLLQEKIKHFDKYMKIVIKNSNKRLKDEGKSQMEELENNIGTMEPKLMVKRIREIMKEMDRSTKVIPEELAKMKNEIIQLVENQANTTKLIESINKNKQEEDYPEE